MVLYGGAEEGTDDACQQADDLPSGGGERWPHTGEGFRSARWGDLEVGYTTAGPLDCTPVYAGLPGGVCPCPHYGFVFGGRLRCTYPGTDRPEEVATEAPVGVTLRAIDPHHVGAPVGQQRAGDGHEHPLRQLDDLHAVEGLSHRAPPPAARG